MIAIALAIISSLQQIRGTMMARQTPSRKRISNHSQKTVVFGTKHRNNGGR